MKTTLGWDLFEGNNWRPEGMNTVLVVTRESQRAREFGVGF